MIPIGRPRDQSDFIYWCFSPNASSKPLLLFNLIYALV
jgi:hypothetical protein